METGVGPEHTVLDIFSKIREADKAISPIHHKLRLSHSEETDTDIFFNDQPMLNVIKAAGLEKQKEIYLYLVPNVFVGSH